jgi:predicted enzyme related to lactoylglutathione lyase
MGRPCASVSRCRATQAGEVAVVLDCQDLNRAADFWTEILGYRRVGEPFGSYFSLLPRSDSGPELLLQKVSDRKGGKNRMHLDLRTRDLAAEVERVVRAGAVRLTNEPLQEGGWLWHVLADPDGNEFCVLQPPVDHWT